MTDTISDVMGGAFAREDDATTDETMTPRQAADKAARYYALKTGVRYVLPATGETFSEAEIERETKALRDELMAYIEDVLQGDPIMVEGQPDLMRQHPETEDVDVPAIFDHAPDVFAALLAARQLKVNAKDARKVPNPAQVMAFNRYTHRLGGTPRLVFDKRGVVR